ncbi:MAG: peptidylprolyl isomerase [Gemmatales bacterium]|nr:peptidylprolyl isomerase [Gemmatales bacterium]MDW8388229.1 peptidylprolyl isomerase [Gemmatales bacterium]
MKHWFRWLFRSKPTRPIRRSTPRRRPRSCPRLEVLEDRTLPAAPTLVNPGTLYVPTGQTLQIPLNGFDADGDPLTFSAVSDNSNVTTSIPTGNPSLRMDITIDSVAQNPLILQLFQDLTPNTVAHIINLVNSGFYDNRIFHRIIPDFMAQLGNDQSNNPDNSTPTIEDEYHATLTFNGFGQLAMANTGARDSGSNQMFITDLDLSVSNTPTSGKRPPQHLNFRHTIFGQLTDGFDTLQNIIAVGGPAPLGTPTANVTITSASVFTDMENGVLRVTAAPGFLGSVTITVTVTDSNGDSSVEVFTVHVVPNTDDGTIGGLNRNDPPFLHYIPPQNAVSGQPLQIPLSYTDIDSGDPRFFAVGGVNNFLFFGNLVNQPAHATVSLNQATGVLTVTPTYPFTGTLQIMVGVRDAMHGVNASAFDTQIVTINVAPTNNTIPTLGTLPDPVQAVSGRTTVVQLTFTDPDTGDRHFFAASAPADFLVNNNLINQPENASLFIDQSTGQLFITPKVGFTGTFQLMIGVRDDAHSDTFFAYNTQIITVNVTGATEQVRVRKRNGKIYIRGTQANDAIDIGLSDDAQNIVIRTSNGGDPRTFARAGITRIIVRTGRGNDRVTVSPNITIRTKMSGGRGDDYLQGGSGKNILRGNRGNDHLIGGPSDDRLKGGRGDDILEGGGGNDILKGKKGNDIVLGGAGNDRVRGGTGDDYLDGGVGNDKVVGGFNDDYVWGGLGADEVRGGKGNNRYGPVDASDTHDGFNTNRDQRPGTFTDNHLLGTRMDLLPGAPADTSGGRVQPSPIDYLALGFENPPHILPTYGPHLASPIPTGISTTPRSPEQVLTNLDIGHVWITYDPALIGDALDRLRQAVNGFGPNSGIVLSPNPGQGVAIVLSSWARQMVLHSYDGYLIRRFVFINRAHGPTAFANP